MNQREIIGDCTIIHGTLVAGGNILLSLTPQEYKELAQVTKNMCDKRTYMRDYADKTKNFKYKVPEQRKHTYILSPDITIPTTPLLPKTSDVVRLSFTTPNSPIVI